MASDTSLIGRYPRLRCAAGNATLAEVKAGKTIVKAVPGRTLTVVGGWMRALGGNAGGSTSVDVSDTAASPVSAVANAVAGLTQNTVLRFGSTSNSVFNTSYTQMTKSKGLQINDVAANSLTTCTGGVDYCVFYTVSN